MNRGSQFSNYILNSYPKAEFMANSLPTKIDLKDNKFIYSFPLVTSTPIQFIANLSLIICIGFSKTNHWQPLFQYMGFHVFAIFRFKQKVMKVWAMISCIRGKLLNGCLVTCTVYCTVHTMYTLKWLHFHHFLCLFTTWT